MDRIAKVLSDVALDREFDYLIPAKLASKVKLGSQVEIPFGNRQTRGFVVGFAPDSEVEGLKEIAGVVGDKPFILPQILDLARWMADYYAAPLEKAIRAVLPSAVRRKGGGEKKEIVVSLSETESEPKGHSTAAQKRVLDCLRKNGTLPKSELLAAAETSPSPIQTLQKKGLVYLTARRIYRDPHENVTLLKTSPPELMDEQRDALKKIEEARRGLDPGVVVLHGVTGSGKTEVYLQVIQRVLDEDKGSIVLVPEISLTPQTVDRFRARFGDCVAVLHSSLSEGERYDEWSRIRDGEGRIVVGARSALFAPVENLGLIVVDEEHEQTYKQGESPHYSARDMAVLRGSREKCAVVLGSATPSLESYYNVVRKRYSLATMNKRVDDREMPLVRIVDMRLEKTERDRPGLFSGELVEAVRDRLNRAEQVMLFLNRRGFSSSLICSECGYVAECEHCSVSLFYHRRAQRLSCHICGANQPAPKNCPNPKCASPDFRYAGAGTEKIEDVAAKLFKGARICRMDSDTMRRKNSYRKVLGNFRVGKIDILIGTQMIAKGLDFPNVTLVGVLNADLALHMPDFRAGERTFQLLTQVSGRAGRGDIKGKVLVQTYTPFHPAIQASRRLSYEEFCDQELVFRKELDYPPAGHLVCVTLRGRDEKEVLKTADRLVEILRGRLSSKVLLSGATPAPLARIKARYRYQIIARAPTAGMIVRPLISVLNETSLPRAVKCSVDVDAQSLM